MTTANTISLGKQIAEHLDAADTLGRWMAHYVASLIASAQANPNDVESQRECARAIAELWSHRSTFPGPNTPLAAFEPIARALERLDPDQPSWGHHTAYAARIESSGTADVTAVKLALMLDGSMGGVIRFLLREATGEAVTAEQKWLSPGELGEEGTSIVDAIINSMRPVTAGREAADALRTIAELQSVLTAIAEDLRDRFLQ